MTHTTDTDILIVGAGPVGLFLANECARRNIRWRLVESNATQSQYSKALAIFPRTMEIFDMAGLVQPFLQAANRVTQVSVASHGRVLARMRFQPEETPYPFVAMVPQNLTEQLLITELQRRGGTVDYETRFVDAVEQPDRVVATLNHRGEESKISAAYLVGCDGAHSSVRHLLNLSFEGAEYADSFMLADVETDESIPANELDLCPSELGPVAIFPMSSTRRRIVAVIDKAEGEMPSLDMVRKVVAERAPLGLEVRGLHWSSYFRIHHRHVSEMRVGRMFVAGDAAHIHSPFGGQGMNTGLHDIWNLVWKLDLGLRGLAKQQLLESYSAERLPVIRQVIKTTHLLTKAMGAPNKLAQLLRNAVIPMVSRLAPFQHAFVQKLSELGIDYGDSPIVEGAGRRYLDDSLRGGKGIGSRFLLLLDERAEDSEVKTVREFCEAGSSLIEMRMRPGVKLALLRPDGYLAYSSPSRDLRSGLEEVRALLERQTTVQREFSTA